MMLVNVEMVELFKQELRLCNVRADECVGVLSEDDVRADYADAILAAAAQLGLETFHLRIKKRVGSYYGKGNSLRGNQAAVDALKCVDVLFDLVGLFFSEEQKQLTDSGTRVILLLEPFDVVQRMMPTLAKRERVERAMHHLSRARRMRITSAAGTDITYELGQYRAFAQYGYAEIPGMWTHLPGAFCYSAGNDDGVNGTVVIDSGDMILDFSRYVQDPITLTVKKNVVTKIAGAGYDAEMVRRHLTGANDPRAYAVSHIGWGVDDDAIWDYAAKHPATMVNTIGMDGRAFTGCVLFSTGPNLELGGTNDVECHLDIPLRNCSVYLDDELIIERGSLTYE